MTLLQAFGVACGGFAISTTIAFALSRNSAARRRASRCAGRSLIRSPHIELEAATNPTNGVRNADPRTVDEPDQGSNNRCTLFEQVVSRGLTLGLGRPYACVRCSPYGCHSW